jgi:hypothetical protein
MIFGILAFSQVEGCQKCFNEISIKYQKVDAAIDVCIEKAEKEGRSAFVNDDWDEGYRAGLRLGLIQGLKSVNDNHKETNVSITQWENILEKKYPKEWLED